MIYGRLIRANNKKCLASKVSRTTNFLERMRGLLCRPPLKEDEALLITSCNSIHMFGMAYPIDVIFLDKNWVVIKYVEQLRPWRLSACAKANMVVELPENKLQQLNLQHGQKLEWDPLNEKQV